MPEISDTSVHCSSQKHCNEKCCNLGADSIQPQFLSAQSLLTGSLVLEDVLRRGDFDVIISEPSFRLPSSDLIVLTVFWILKFQKFFVQISCA